MILDRFRLHSLLRSRDLFQARKRTIVGSVEFGIAFATERPDGDDFN
jgi:hypothetical protein